MSLTPPPVYALAFNDLKNLNFHFFQFSISLTHGSISLIIFLLGAIPFEYTKIQFKCEDDKNRK